MLKMENINDKLIELSQVMFEQNVPVGITMSDSGKFCVKFSLSQNIKTFATFEEAIQYISKYDYTPNM